MMALSDLARQPMLSNYEKAQLHNYFAYTCLTLERNNIGSDHPSCTGKLHRINSIDVKQEWES